MFVCMVLDEALMYVYSVCVILQCNTGKICLTCSCTFVRTCSHYACGLDPHCCIGIAWLFNKSGPCARMQLEGAITCKYDNMPTCSGSKIVMDMS